MDQEELQLFEAFGNYATENVFWSLVFINNAAFRTPLREEVKNKLLGMNKMYDTIITSIYPSEDGRNLVAAMGNNNRFFVAYVEHLMQEDSQANAFKQKWKENGRQMAMLLCKMNPYWKAAEWSAMIGHESDLLDTIASNLKSKNCSVFANTAPICQRLAVDMSKYMSVGIVKQNGDKW